MRRVFWLAFAAFFLVGAAWAVALPVNGTYDEKHHIARAYAVVSGQWLPRGPAPDPAGYGFEGFDVPASLLPGDVDCMRLPVPRPASCLKPAGPRTETVRVTSNTARYSPVYYLPVGLPMLVSPNTAGIIAGRLVSAALSALLLALAAATAFRYAGRLALAAVALVATPMVMNLAGAINPNGLEIAAGVLLFASLLPLARGAPPTRGLVWQAGAAMLLLLTLRQFGPLLCAVDVLACLALAGPETRRALLRDRDTRRIIGGAALLGVAFFAFWVLVSGWAYVRPLPRFARHERTGTLLREVATVRVRFYLQQIVGQFGYGEAGISRLAIALWYALWAVPVLAVLWTAARRVKLVLVGLAVFCGALLVGLELRYAPVVGWSQHGRYVLPTAVGIVLVAAWYAPPALAGRRWLPLALVAATVPVHGYALARTMTRYQAGLGAPLDPFGGVWTPPGGPLVALATAGAGLALLAALVWRSSTAGEVPTTVVASRSTTNVTTD